MRPINLAVDQAQYNLNHTAFDFIIINGQIVAHGRLFRVTDAMVWSEFFVGKVVNHD